MDVLWNFLGSGNGLGNCEGNCFHRVEGNGQGNGKSAVEYKHFVRQDIFIKEM